MPQATDKHREEVVEIHSELTMTVAAQRNIEVVAQPLRERYVPAVPKLGDILRLIGKVEVLRQRKAHDKGDTDSHVRVAREVAIYLHRVAEHSHKIFEARVGLGRGEDNVVILSDIICQ